MKVVKPKPTEGGAIPSHAFKPGDAVVDTEGDYGEVIEWEGEELPTPHHVFVKVAKSHPLAHLDHPICYSSDRLKKVEKAP